MSDTTTADTDNPETNGTPANGGKPETDGEPGSGPGQVAQDTGIDGEDRTDELPEWARKALSKANAEAAGYRTKLRELEAKNTDTPTGDDKPDAATNLKQRNADLEAEVLRLTVAYEQELPKALAGRLRGSTRAELEADAKELAKLVADRTPADLRGGLDPTDEDTTPDDPGELARCYGRRR
ncbi:hypothetical protein GCM10010124_02170 [Pilimelia terevasa]|uniref:Scaffolding protein n=1 Tax=Pilimelia terevasa TaxID=53372 RepID=A0A8J3BDB3_9ACTN|nr:hypothetical protein [Pilimelia terevasa]GGK13178.1 hypothetical protein GCM10010124_02170 [Pilimelia terevasa]